MDKVKRRKSEHCRTDKAGARNEQSENGGKTGTMVKSEMEAEKTSKSKQVELIKK